MTNLSASDLAGRRIREARTRRKWTVKELADRCAEAGAPHITATVITNLETRRRRSREITVDELLVLAHVLEVAPVALFAPLDGAEVLEVVPGAELGALDAAAWIADDDAMLGPVREALRSAPRDTERVIRRRPGTSPLTLVRQIRVLARAIKVRDRRLSNGIYGQNFADSENYDRNSITVFGIRVLELTDWLASLGYAPPELAEVRAAIQRANAGIPGEQEEDMRGPEMDPPEIVSAQQVLYRAMTGSDVPTPGSRVLDPAVDAEDEVAGSGPRP